MKVRRQPDGRPWRAADVSAALEAQLGVVVSKRRIEQLLNRDATTVAGADLRDALAVLFQVPLAYFAQPLDDDIRAVHAQVDADLQGQLRAIEAGEMSPASNGTPAAEEADELDWTGVTRGLTQGVMRYADGVAAELDLTTSQAVALLHLVASRRASLTLGEMAELCRLSPSNASRIADVLEARGVLQPAPLQIDDSKKARRLAVTSKAKEIVDRHTRPRPTVQALLASMTPDQLRTVKALMAVIGDLADSPGDGVAPEQDVTNDQKSPGSRAGRGVA